MICPVLAGREAELSAIEQVLRGNSAPILLLSGEAGIGKSRLAGETRILAERVGFTCFRGAAFEGDASLPYGPLGDLLRNLLAAHEHFLPQLLAGRIGLEAVVPELAPRFGEGAPALAGEPEQRKRALFVTLSGLFTDLSRDRPLLLEIEDLHWSDDTSLEFLLYLARQEGSRLRLLLTYRSDEVRNSLRHFLASLDRQRLAVEVALDRISPAAVAEMVKAMLPAATNSLSNTIDELTDGNPFFIEEVVKSLADAGALNAAGQRPIHLDAALIPRSVHDAVSRRLERLSPEARRLARVAAVAGRRFNLELLKAASALAEDVLRRCTAELVSAQLVIEETADRFVFRHALTQQAVYAGLLTRERRDLHRTIGATAEGLAAGEQDIEELAEHFFLGEVWQSAFDYALRAAAHARQLHASQAAINHYTRAINALAALGRPSPADLYRERGQTYELLGDFERAQSDYEAALRLSREQADADGEWQGLMDLGFLWSSRDYAAAGGVFDQALALARSSGDRALLGRSLNRVGNWRINRDEPVEAIALHEQALVLFTAMEDRRGEAETLDLLGLASLIGGNAIRARAYYGQAIELLGELGELHWQCSAMSTCPAGGNDYIGDLVLQPQHSEAGAVVVKETAVALARSLQWPAGEAYALLTYSAWCGGHALYARAIEAVERALVIADEINHGQWRLYAGYVAGMLYLDLFEVTRAREHLQAAFDLGQEFASLHGMRSVAGPLAGALIGLRNLDAAGAVLDAALGQNEAADSLGKRSVWFGRAELAMALGNPAEALRICELLLAAPSRDPGASVPRISRLKAEALLALGRPAEACAEVEAALPVAIDLEAKPLIWRLRALRGRVLERDRPNEADGEFAAARSLLDDVAAELSGERAAHYLRHATALLPRAYRYVARRSADASLGGLTHREREIAALIASGKTNRELAEALVLSERTVETHISRIMAKLDFRSRAQIAAWAVEHLPSDRP